MRPAAAEGRRRPDAPPADQALRGLRRRLPAQPAWWISPSCCCAPTSCWRDNPALLAHYRRRFRHVLVDEFQDTNAIQYALAAAAGGPRRRAVRGGRRRPVHLPLARRARREPARSSPRDYPGRAAVPPGAELPLHRQHPRRRERADREQHRPPRQEPVDQRQRRRAHQALRRLQRARRSRVRHAAASATGSRQGGARARRGDPVSLQRAVARVRRGVDVGAHSLRCTAACASSSAPRSRTRWPTCG